MSEESEVMKKSAETLMNLRAAGIMWVMGCFDGSGDSGSIECILAWSKADRPTGQYDEVGRAECDEWNEVLDELVNAFLGLDGTDWYNNDGGFGELLVDVTTGAVELDMNTRYTETNNTQNHWHVPLPKPQPVKQASATVELKSTKRDLGQKRRTKILAEGVKEEAGGSTVPSRDIVG